MKRFLALALLALMSLSGLSGCGCDDDIQADLVFVNDSNAIILTVVADYADQTTGTRNANGSPLKRGDSFGFQGEYPVTVAVYDQIVDDFTQRGVLAQIVIREAPPEGERWYVAARDGANSGLTLTADTKWPEGA